MNNFVCRTPRGNIYPGELRPTEPQEDRYEEPMEEEIDDGIDLDDGWVLQMGKGWRKMTDKENREMEYLRLCGTLQKLSELGIDASREEALRCCEGIMEALGAWPVLISSEGYKTFRGTMHIIPGNPAFPPYDLDGDWLYKPDTGCWYCKGRSFPAETCEILGVAK